jgi:hypothetical protein
MSIAFITLIFGFLLGKFTSDRNHLIKENYRRMHDTKPPQNEVDKLINSLSEVAKNFNVEQFSKDHNKNYDSEATAINMHKIMHNNFTNCLSDVNYEQLSETIEDLDDFLKHMLRNYYENFKKCVTNLRKVLLT